METRRDISAFSSKPLVYSLIGLFLSVFLFFIFHMNIIVAMVLAVTPLTAYLLIRLLKWPVLAFFGVITLNYFIMGLIRYIPGIQGGVVMDGLLLFTFFFVLLRSRDYSINWIGARNLFTVLSGIWLIYCILLVFNPATTLADWSAGVRGLAVYLFLFPLLTAVLLNRFRYLKIFLFLWSVLTLLAVVKALVQKYIGFDAAENHWLYVEGGRSTHIISSGIRYFSFFTDAASFGTSMGLSMIVFTIVGLYVGRSSLQFYYFAVALLAGYGMVISGTRAAIAVPFAGYAFFILLSKQWKIIIPGVLIILCTFVFFKYTYIGHGNAEIRRIRSAFNPTESASFQLRKTNQVEMQVFMKAHPFGIGIGKAKRAEPGDYMYGLPTDTSLVYIWVETGIVGLAIFLLIFFITLGRGWYDIWFRFRNRQLRGVMSALLGGLAGMLVSAYGNETLQQFPNGPIVYMCMAFVFMGRKFDKEINDEQAVGTIHHNG